MGNLVSTTQMYSFVCGRKQGQPEKTQPEKSMQTPHPNAHVMMTTWNTALSSTQTNSNGANSGRFHELEEICTTFSHISVTKTLVWKVKLLIIDIRPLCMKSLF